MKHLHKALLMSAAIGITFTSCKKDDDNNGGNGGNGGGGNGQTRYIVAATPLASTGVADYLLTAGDLTKDSITTIGNGVEQDGTYRYYITNNNRLFSLLYGQGNPGAVTTYNLNPNGSLNKVSNFQTESVHCFTNVDDQILLIRVPRSGDSLSKMYRIDAKESIIAGESQLNIVRLAGNGERAHFTWATQVGNKIFAPYMSIKGAAPDVFGTAYPDSTWVAVLSYPELKVEKIIRDNRTSSIGAYFLNGMAKTENGDVYAFSPASATNTGALASTKPSAIVRIKNGTTEFDQGYFFNAEQATGGHHIFRMDYIGNGKALLQMYGKPNSIATDGNIKFAIADYNTQSITWVTGLPTDVKQFSVSRDNLVADDVKSIFVGLNGASEGAYVWNIDAATAKATRGLKVSGGVITSIRKLTIN